MKKREEKVEKGYKVYQKDNNLFLTADKDKNDIVIFISCEKTGKVGVAKNINEKQLKDFATELELLKGELPNFHLFINGGKGSKDLAAITKYFRILEHNHGGEIINVALDSNTSPKSYKFNCDNGELTEANLSGLVNED